MSMTRGELLARCIPILDAAKEGKPVEDSFVELKSELPQEAKAARVLAGSASFFKIYVGNGSWIDDGRLDINALRDSVKD